MIDLLSRYKILVAEDDEEVLDNLVKYLSSYTDYIYKARDGREMLEKQLRYQPDIILCDVQMPELDGLEAIKRIRENGARTIVIFISAFSETRTLLSAIEIGCSGYIVKPIRRDQIEERLTEAVKQLESTPDRTIDADKLTHIDQNTIWNDTTKTITVNGAAIELTKKERTLLSLLISKRGIICSFDEIIFEVWASDDPLGEKASIANLKNIVKKLRLKLPRDLIKNRYGEGYLIEKI